MNNYIQTRIEEEGMDLRVFNIKGTTEVSIGQFSRHGGLFGQPSLMQAPLALAPAGEARNAIEAYSRLLKHPEDTNATQHLEQLLGITEDMITQEESKLRRSGQVL